MRRLVVVLALLGALMAASASPAGASTSSERKFLAAVRDGSDYEASAKDTIRAGRLFCADVRASSIEEAVTHSSRTVVDVTDGESEADADEFSSFVIEVNFDAIRYLCPRFFPEMERWIERESAR